jgi:D-amino peptidase
MNKPLGIGLALALVCQLALGAAAQEKKGLKVYISVDMEGIGGVVTRDQTGPQGWEYQQARKWMTAEANAAIEGAFEAGATEVLVSDSLGNAQSLILDELDPRVRLIRAWPRKLIMMEGIDETFDAAIFIGYHASEGMRHATLAHTMIGNRIVDIKLNGGKVPEAGFNAAIAGHFGVPVVLVSGDQTIIAETRALVGAIEGAEVKTGIGTVAKMMHPTKAQTLIKERAKAALARLRDFKPWRLSTPITIEITFKSEENAEVVGFFPGVRMVDGRTIQYTGKDMVEISGFFAAVAGL